MVNGKKRRKPAKKKVERKYTPEEMKQVRQYYEQQQPEWKNKFWALVWNKLIPDSVELLKILGEALKEGKKSKKRKRGSGGK